MNFEHIATRIPLNVRVDIWNIILYNIGLKNKAITNVWTIMKLVIMNIFLKE